MSNEKEIGPNSEALISPLDARCKHLEEFHHILPPLATAIVCQAEACYTAADIAAQMQDRLRVKMLTTAFLASWSNIGAAFDMCSSPMGLSQTRLYAAARYTLERTIRENKALEHRLDTDPAFAEQYAQQVAGATAEDLIARVARTK